MIDFPRRRRVYLMRHGEAAYVADDGTVTDDPRNVPLTRVGRAQAKQQGDALSAISFDRAVCSGLPRTVETIGLVLAQNAHPRPDIEIVPKLEEIQGMKGDRKWPPPEGSAEAALRDIANPWAAGADPEARFLGGERFGDFQARIVPEWETLMADPGWDTLLLVAHGAVNRGLLNHIIGVDWRGDLCFEQDNCNINIIDLDDTSPRRYLIRALNLTAYNVSKDGIHLTNMESTAKRVAETLAADGSGIAQ